MIQPGHVKLMLVQLVRLSHIHLPGLAVSYKPFNSLHAAAGLVRALWSPTGRDVVTVADFNVRMSSWDLRTQNCSHLPAPKHADRGIHYSKCGQHLAVIEVRLSEICAVSLLQPHQ